MTKVYSAGSAAYHGLPQRKYVDHDLAEKARSLNPRIVIPYALADANDIRRALAIGEGKLEKLPIAKLADSHDCVLARALSNGWAADVGSGGTTLTHPASGITFEQVNLAVNTLAELGFERVVLYPKSSDLGESSRSYEIHIPHTWAMAEFVSWYDKGAFPELVLDSDEAGQRISQEFQEKVARGTALSEIHDNC